MANRIVLGKANDGSSDVIIIAGTGGAGNDDQSDGDVAGCSDGGDGGNVYIAGGYKGSAAVCHPWPTAKPCWCGSCWPVKLSWC